MAGDGLEDFYGIFTCTWRERPYVSSPSRPQREHGLDLADVPQPLEVGATSIQNFGFFLGTARGGRHISSRRCNLGTLAFRAGRIVGFNYEKGD
jgi:hypothetical protein